ncbi:hypothetical protein ACP70R_015357 [Stipagrostis hirtigluma subsp. patula]
MNTQVTSGDDDLPTKKRTHDEEAARDEFRCELCDLPMQAVQYTSHVNGKRHRNAMEKAKWSAMN